MCTQFHSVMIRCASTCWLCKSLVSSIPIIQIHSHFNRDYIGPESRIILVALTSMGLYAIPEYAIGSLLSFRLTCVILTALSDRFCSSFLHVRDCAKLPCRRLQCFIYGKYVDSTLYTMPINLAYTIPIIAVSSSFMHNSSFRILHLSVLFEHLNLQFTGNNFEAGSYFKCLSTVLFCALHVPALTVILCWDMILLYELRNYIFGTRRREHTTGVSPIFLSNLISMGTRLSNRLQCSTDFNVPLDGKTGLATKKLTDGSVDRDAAALQDCQTQAIRDARCKQFGFLPQTSNLPSLDHLGLGTAHIKDDLCYNPDDSNAHSLHSYALCTDDESDEIDTTY